MTKLSFEESSLPTNLVAPIREKGVQINPATDAKELFASVFISMATFLSHVKSKDKKESIAINNLKGDLILAGIVEYHPNEEDASNPGNWTFEFTFNKEDLEGSDPHLSTDPFFQRIVINVLLSEFKIEFSDARTVELSVEAVAKTLKDWLEQNAKEDDVMEVELEGVFLASTAIEEGERVFSVTPDGALKKVIKNDAALEVPAL